MPRLLSASLVLWSLALLGGETPASLPAGQLVITLHADSISNGDPVYLGEIASFTGISDDLRTRLQALSLGRAAPPGQICSFNTGDVSQALHRAGFALTPQYQGPREIKVTATAQTLSGQAIADTARNAVLKLFSADPDIEVHVEVTATPADVALRPGQTRVNPEIEVERLRPGVQTIQVHLSQNGRHISDAVVRLRLSLIGTVQVAVEYLAPGDVLAPNMIKKIRKELNFNDLQNRCDASKLVNLRAKNGISAGQLLSRELFSLPYLIRRGEHVRVSVTCGLLEVATMGEAKGDAAVDEPVRLLLDDGAEVLGRATALREACVEDPHNKRM